MTTSGLALGFDIGGTKIAGAVVDERGSVVDELVEPTPEDSDAEAVTAVLLGMAERFRSRHDVVTIGVGAAGIVEWPAGRIVWAPNNDYRDWPLREQLEKATGLPVVVDNDANVAALAEARLGEPYPNMVLITVGTGVGGGLILDGRIYRGPTGLGGELGHIVLNPDGPRCGCGNHGCFEAFASGTALTRMGRDAAADEPEGMIARLGAEEGAVTGKIVTRAALAGRSDGHRPVRAARALARSRDRVAREHLRAGRGRRRWRPGGDRRAAARPGPRRRPRVRLRAHRPGRGPDRGGDVRRGRRQDRSRPARPGAPPGLGRCGGNRTVGSVPLVLGPVLRHVGETTASVWVQTDSAATVTVLGCEAHTFEVRGHHYALVPVTGLEPESSVPYQVHVDGEQVWPPASTPFPPSRIRTRGPGSHHTNRIIFGSCRYPKVADPALTAKLGIDALDAYAARMIRRPPQEWPDALLLLGDQVYADELTPQNRRRIAGRSEREPDWPDDEIVGYEEYVGLYQDSWTDPEVRWLMSTVPTAMIFDDHDVRDDWNTSAAWRAEMREKPWWRSRIQSALASYWVYQHIGNLPSDDLGADPDYRKIVDHGADVWPLLADLADRADAEADGGKGVRFSFRWDLGNARFLMIDSRNGRLLENDRHLMLGDSEFDWIEEQVAAPGQVDHLVIGTSVPWLLPHAIGDLETVNEIAAARPGVAGPARRDHPPGGRPGALVGVPARRSTG